jgi:hypothetical protein
VLAVKSAKLKNDELYVALSERRGPDRITENRLRAIASLVDWDAQIQLFRSHLAGSQR